MSYDLRDHIANLENHGLLRRVQAEVDKNWELSGVMRWVYIGHPEDERYAVLFEQVKGYDIPVVVGAIAASYKTYALALGLDINQPRASIMTQIRQRWNHALDNPLAPMLVDSGPVHDKVFTGADIDTKMLPVPVWTPEKDRGWDQGLGFITSPYHISKDPVTGVRNVGTYRTMVRPEPNILGICGAQGCGLAHHIRKNEANGKYTEIATVIGCDPTIGITSTTEIPHGLDELAVAGALRGEPIPVVKCKTLDLEVPANAEIVIEGRLLPRSEREWEAEGPFGEYTGYQGSAKYNPVYEVTAITMRNDAIYQAFISQMPPSESSKLRHISYEALILRNLQAAGIQGIVDISIPESGQASVIILAIDKLDEGHPMRIANSIFATLQPRWGKIVIVVDSDIDVYDLDNIIWAISFRTSLARNRRNVYFVEGLVAPGLDYSAGNSIDDQRVKHELPADGMVIDATRPFIPYPVVSLPPSAYLRSVVEQWHRYGLPDLPNKTIPKVIEKEEENIRMGISALPNFVPFKK